MTLEDKRALTWFAMEFEGTHFNVRFPHRIKPIPRITSKKKGENYHLEVETGSGKVLNYCFDSSGKITSRSVR